MAEAKKARRGVMRKVAIAGAVAIALLAVLAVLAPRFVDCEKVRQTAETEGSKALGREVRIKTLTVSLFSGIEVGGLRIGGAKGTDQPPLVQADRVVARYELLPLLWLKVVVNRVELDGPKLWVGKDARGRWSFADLVAAAPAGRTEPARAKPVSLPVGVDIALVAVKGAVLAYRDASVRPAFTAGVDKLDVQLRNLSLAGAPATLKLSCVATMDGKSVPIALDGRLGIALDRSLLTLDGLTAVLPGIKAVTSGEIREFQTLPTLKLNEDVAVDLAAVWSGYREFIPKSLRDWMTVTGQVAVRTAVTGTAKKPGLDGTLTAKAVGVNLSGMEGALESCEGTVKFTGDTLASTDLRFIALGSAYTLEAELSHVGLAAAATGGFNLARWAPRGRFRVESPKVVLDRFLPPLDAKPAAKGAPVPPPAPEPDYHGMVPRGLDLDGTVGIKEVVARKVTIAGVKGSVKIAGGNVAYDLTDASYGGKDAASGKVFLTKVPLEYAVQGKFSGLHVKGILDDGIASFVSKNKELQGRMSGVADGEYRITGKGITMPSLQKHLAGSCRFAVTDGVVSKFSFFENGLGKLLKLDWLAKDLPFKTAGGNVTLAGGKAHTPDLTMDPGPDGDLGVIYKGDLGFDMKLKGEMVTRIHPRHVDEVMKGDVGKAAFTLENGWAVGYWDVTGTVKLPIILPSRKHLIGKAKQEAVQELKKQLPDVKDKAKDALKGLFKKKK